MLQFILYDGIKKFPPNYKYEFQSGQFKLVKTYKYLATAQTCRNRTNLTNFKEQEQHQSLS